MDKVKLIQKHNQIIFEEYSAKGPVTFGPYSSYTWRHDPKHIIFTLARYKFCAKILTGKENILEVGCGDSLGIPILLQSVKRIHGIDMEEPVITNNRKRNEYPTRVSFQQLDITKNTTHEKFDSAVSIDVLEHIPQNSEDSFMQNICFSLKEDAICIVGTPNISANRYASKNSADGHINLKSYDSLRHLFQKYFYNVIIFSMNDEIIHTGFSQMAHYLIAVGLGPKNEI